MGEIADVGVFDKDYFVVKLRVYGYWVTFLEGSLAEIFSQISEIARMVASDVISCPFCGAKFPYADPPPRCRCGATIYREQSCTLGGHPNWRSREVCKIWETAKEQIKGISDEEWLVLRTYLYPDQAFENVYYIKPRYAEWRVWFVRDRWKLTEFAKKYLEFAKIIRKNFNIEEANSLLEDVDCVFNAKPCEGLLCPRLPLCIDDLIKEVESLLEPEDELEPKILQRFKKILSILTTAREKLRRICEEYIKIISQQ